MTRTICPNCGAPWEGLETSGTPQFPHTVARCCHATIEYIERLEASPTVALSVRLAQLEYAAKRGGTISPADTLDIITELRRYMAMAEDVKASVERSIKNLDRLEGV